MAKEVIRSNGSWFFLLGCSPRIAEAIYQQLYHYFLSFASMLAKLQSACAQIPLGAVWPLASTRIRYFELLWVRNSITVCTAPNTKGAEAHD